MKNGIKILFALVILVLTDARSQGLINRAEASANRGSRSSCDSLLFHVSKATQRFLLAEEGSQIKFGGLTQEGITFLKEQRNILRARVAALSLKLRGYENLHHAALVARLAKLNMLILGPTGSGKTDFVRWFMEGEPQNPFIVQMNPTITEQAFIGGQKFADAKRGKFKINSVGSLADHRVGFIDEGDKGSPMAYSAIYSLLNERMVFTGQAYQAQTQTIFMSSNANLPELFQIFSEMGLKQYALPLFNRFQLKASVPNWLNLADQAYLDRSRMAKKIQNSAEQEGYGFDHAHSEPLKNLDYDGLRTLAHAWITTTPEFLVSYREILSLMRAKTHEKIKESDRENQGYKSSSRLPYMPTVEYSERLRGDALEGVIMSFFIDFLLSPLSDDSELFEVSRKPITMDPYSLWRLSYFLTTLGHGQMSLEQEGASVQEVQIQFGVPFAPLEARTPSEEAHLSDRIEEQNWLNNIYRELISRYVEALTQRSRFISDPGLDGESEVSWESKLIRLRQ